MPWPVYCRYNFSDVERAILLCSDGAAAGDALYNSITVKLKNFPDQHSPESFFNFTFVSYTLHMTQIYYARISDTLDYKNGGNKMNCLKRAYLYVTRKKGKSILLFLILLVTATFVLSGLCIGDATRQAQMNLRKNLGGAFDMTINYSEDNPYYRQEESENDDGTKDVLMYSMKQVSPEMVANIRNITGVKYCDASTENLYDGLLPIPGTVPVEEKFSHYVTGIGVWRSSEQNFFTSEKLTLIAGRHIAENDTHSAIISDVLAEKNQIKLGDTFTITGGSRKKSRLK